MTRVQRRALHLLHHGYTVGPAHTRRIWPKWAQAYAIAKREERRFGTWVGDRLMGFDPPPLPKSNPFRKHAR